MASIYFYRAAYFADKILHGTAPGDLPVEFPSKMVMFLNLKTAKNLRATTNRREVPEAEVSRTPCQPNTRPVALLSNRKSCQWNRHP
jgi:hypothetical protein